MREHLTYLADVLARAGEKAFAEQVRAALAGDDIATKAFLVSNDLWGGAGSIADQAGIDVSRKDRRRIEEALIKLGIAQMNAGVANPKTAGWVSAFER
jgi:hypothetical protein